MPRIKIHASPEERAKYLSDYRKRWRDANPDRLAVHRETNRAPSAERDALRSGRPWAPGQTELGAEIAKRGCCEICAAVETDKRRHAIDHDHVSGKLRGLLCARCNSAIAVLESAKLDAMIAYLRKYA